MDLHKVEHERSGVLSCCLFKRVYIERPILLIHKRNIVWEISVSRVREKNPYLGIYMGIVFPVVVACNLDSLSRHFGYC